RCPLFFFSSRRRHTRSYGDWSSDVCSSDLIQRRTEQVIRDFDVRPPNPMLPARALSGGNQQKLIIGREFELPPKLLLVSQPTRRSEERRVGKALRFRLFVLCLIQRVEMLLV